ncbi:MAG: hypothetical protein JXA07_08270 [Spirochaetes bacterium]|nr:hypothetical protein [Spirochaetota bacterium]
MGILKDTGEAIVRFGEIIVNKTEEYAKIGKLNVDIKRLQIDLGIAEKELGRYIITKIESGATSIDASDQQIKDLHEKITDLKKKITEKNAEIERVKETSKTKMESRAEKKPDSGAQ